MVVNIDDIACDAVKLFVMHFACDWYVDDDILVLLDAARDEGVDADRTARRLRWLQHHMYGKLYITYSIRIEYLRTILGIK